MSRFSKMERWQQTLAIVFLTQLFSAIGFSIVFPFLPLYVEELDSTTGMNVEILAGLVISAQAFTMMLAAPIWGALADRRGRKMMVVRASFGGAVTLALMAFVQSSEQLILLRAVQGLITGTVAAASALVAAETPRERIGLSLGTLQVALWAGVAAGPLIGGILADAFGYRLPFIITAVLLVIAGALAWIGVRENFRPIPGPERPGMVAEWRRVVSRKGIVPTFNVRFITGIGRTVFTPIIPLFVASLMTSEEGVATTTGLITGIAAATGTAGAMLLGKMGDNIGHRRILIGSAVAMAAFHLPQVWATTVWQLLILQTMAGFVSGGITAAPSALLAQYTPSGEEGSVYGLDNSVTSAARAIAPLIGSAFAVWFGMRSTLALATALFLLTAVLAHIQLPRAIPRPEAQESPGYAAR